MLHRCISHRRTFQNIGLHIHFCNENTHKHIHIHFFFRPEYIYLFLSRPIAETKQVFLVSTQTTHTDDCSRCLCARHSPWHCAACSVRKNKKTEKKLAFHSIIAVQSNCHAQEAFLRTPYWLQRSSTQTFIISSPIVAFFRWLFWLTLQLSPFM